MTEADIEIILQRAKELLLQARPRIISDDGPQFIVRDFIFAPDLHRRSRLRGRRTRCRLNHTKTTGIWDVENFR
jgi:hypothetical protein